MQPVRSPLGLRLAYAVEHPRVDDQNRDRGLVPITPTSNHLRGQKDRRLIFNFFAKRYKIPIEIS